MPWLCCNWDGLSGTGAAGSSLEFLRRAGELAPEHTGVLKQLHRALRAVGQDREAAIVLEKLKTAGPDRTPLKAQAQIFDYMGLDPAQQRERFRHNLVNAIAPVPPTRN